MIIHELCIYELASSIKLQPQSQTFARAASCKHQLGQFFVAQVTSEEEDLLAHLVGQNSRLASIPCFITVWPSRTMHASWRSSLTHTDSYAHHMIVEYQ